MGHSTSVSLEQEFWAIIDLICHNHKISFAALLAVLERKSLKNGNLASNLRVLCLNYVSRLQPFSFEEFSK